MLYVFGQNEKLLTIISNENPQTCPYFNAEHTEKLNGQNTFDFSVPFSHADSVHVVEENLVAFKDQDGDYQLFVIRQVEDTHDGQKLKAAYCESAATELIDEIITDQRPTDTTADVALSNVLINSRWQVGTVDNLGQGSTTFYYISTLNAVHKIAKTWGGELRFRVLLTGTGISARYVDILDRRGTDTGKRFEYTKDVTSITRKVDTSSIKTALYGRGKGEPTEDGWGRRITFADVAWDTANGDPAKKSIGQEWVADPIALEQYGRPNGDGTKRHRVGVFEEAEETDPARLLDKTWAALQETSTPLIQYDMKVIDLENVWGLSHEKTRLGDTGKVLDREFVPLLAVEARVIEITRFLDVPEKAEVKVGNFMPTLYNETAKIEQIEHEISERKGIWETVSDPNAPVSTDRLEGIIDTLQNEVQAGTGSVTITDRDGILVVDDPDTPTKAVRLLGGMLAISDTKDDVTGDWIWRTFGTGSGFTADEINAGSIQTNNVQITGNSNFYWNGDYLYIIDPGNTNKQIRLSREGIRFTGDGGQTWTVAINVDGVNADAINAGVIKAGLVEIGPDTAYDSGYDPSLKETPAGAQAKADQAEANVKTEITNHDSNSSPHNLPSYTKMEADGFKVYDSSNVLRAHMGQYSSGKYGIKINQGQIYASSFRSGAEGADDYVSIGSGWSPINLIQGGEECLSLWADYNWGGFIHFSLPDSSTGDPDLGRIGCFDDAAGQGLKIVGGESGNEDMMQSAYYWQTDTVHCRFDSWSNGSTYVDVDGEFSADTKNNKQMTVNYGIRLLTVRESPDERYIIEDKAQLIDGECRVDVDPVYLECIDADTVNPWLIQLTPYANTGLFVAEIGSNYFVVKERSGGTSNSSFAWSLSAKRINSSKWIPEYFPADDPVMTSGWEDEIL